jgi:hypothetical protein
VEGVMGGYVKGGFTPMTDEERAASNERILAHMEKKFITDRTPEKFKARLLALEPVLSQAATELETEYRTLMRWCRPGGKGPPGVAWVALELWETDCKRKESCQCQEI